ncbi:TRAP transporter substrate-binding protein [Rhizobacter sp. OV335]|uniref:TRAP transporter substrate-binding protein n=1 Tax=Rhizobacter sp. OV335 TaxID=1500264 RepID=UPI00092238F7|nr:TRAP transporter substrate-binding protein [Rhizobacter sp. OV335]SHN26590.1 TRAP-type mannitol/chloroaromatic compound transport system, substrate-binding protein [Rhizobacter sp. OV335]
MERRSFITRTGLAGVLAAASAGAPALVHAQTALRWRLASSFPKSLDTIFGAAEVFAKKVGELSGGKFQISVHAAGEIMPAFGVVDAVQNATVEIAHTAPYYFFGKDETFALGCAIPFGLNSRQMTAWMFEGNGLKLMREFYKNFNIISFPGGNTGAQMGGWYRKEIKSAADIKGLKIRIGGFAGRVIERMGGVPQNIPGGDIYPALEKGTIDAAEWVGPYDDQKLGFNKVAPNYYYPGWWEGGPQLDFFVNTKAYDALTPEYKAVVEAAAAVAHIDMQAKYDARNPGALKQLVGSGTKLFRFPKDVMDLAFKESMAIYAELSGKNPNWKKVYEDFSKFRADQNLWFRFTEAGFDEFMQQQKL